MKRFATLLLALLLCGCGGRKHVSHAEFKTHYGNVDKAGSMQTTDYLGQRDGWAYICVSSMSVVSHKWSEQVLYVELADLEPEFRDSLPKTEMKDAQREAIAGDSGITWDHSVTSDHSGLNSPGRRGHAEVS